MTQSEKTATTSPGRARRPLAIAFLLLCAAAIAILVLPDLRVFRYAGEYRGHALQMFCRDTPVDVVVVGTSRMARAVDSGKIAAAYRDKTGQDLTVLDLSKVGPSEIVWETLLEDLTASRNVKLIVAEYAYYRNPSKWLRHIEKVGAVLPGQRVFAEIRKASAASESSSLAGDILTFVSMRLRFLESGALSLWTGCPAQYRTTLPPDPTLSRPQDTKFLQYAPGLGADSYQAFPDNRLLDTRRNPLQIDNAETLVALAGGIGADIIFVNHNSIQFEQVSAASRERFTERFGADLVTWPARTDRLLKSEYLYADKTHFDEDGATVFADWLAGEIATRLPAGS